MEKLIHSQTKVKAWWQNKTLNMLLRLTISAAICLPCGKSFVRFLKGLPIVLVMFLFLFLLNENLILSPLNLMELETWDSTCTVIAQDSIY